MAVTGFVYGTLAMGRVDRVAHCSVVTQFRMLNGIPTYILDSCLNVSGQLVAIPRHRRSVVAGILRSWLFFLACVVFLLLRLVSPQHSWLLAIPALFMLGGAYSWLFYGLLTASEKRMRMAYATWLGAPFDPALLPADWPAPCLEALCKFVDERAPHAPIDYRMAHGDHWRMVATESDDPEFLIAACTRARFARRGATLEERIELDALHAAMWRKLDVMLSTSAPAAFLQWQEYVDHYEKSNMLLTPRIALAGTAVLAILGVILVPLDSYLQQPQLAIVNVTQFDGLTVLLDGKPIAERLPRASYENDAAFRVMRIKPGQHELITQNATGREIDRQTVVITDRKHKAVLYVPARSIDLCFYVEKATYASLEHYRGYDLVKLDMTKSLHLFEMKIMDWFESPPDTVSSSNNTVTKERFAVRALACELDAKGIRE